MSEAKPTLKHRVFHGIREYFVISGYLFVVFALFTTYKAVILAQQHIGFTPHGLALINALALAKVILTAQELHLADQFRDAPLIYPTLLKSFVFAILLACFKIVEETAIGAFHGESFHESIATIGGGSWQAIATLTALMFFVLIPFFGFTELRRVFGEDRLVGALFRPRHLLNLPPTAS